MGCFFRLRSIDLRFWRWSWLEKRLHLVIPIPSGFYGTCYEKDMVNSEQLFFESVLDGTSEKRVSVRAQR